MPADTHLTSTSQPFLEFRVGKDGVSTKSTIQKFEHFITVRGFNNYLYLDVIDPSHETIEKFLEESPYIEFRHGWQDGRITAWKKYEVIWYESKLRSSDSLLTIYAEPRPRAMTLNDKSRSFKEMPISEMVQTIISEYGFETKISPTRGDFTLRQHNISDDRFIQDWLLPRAFSTEQASVDCYDYYGVGGKEVHFHPRDTKLTPFKTYYGYHDSVHPMFSFRYIHDKTDYASSFARLTVKGYNPVEKKEINYQIDHEILGSKQIQLGKKYKSYEGSPDGTGRYFRTPFESTPPVENLGVSMWTRQSKRAFVAEMVMRADPDLEPGRFADVRLESSGGSGILKKSGLYFVDSCYFMYNMKKYDMKCILTRNATGFGNTDASGATAPASSHKSKLITNVQTYGETTKKIKSTIHPV